MLTELFNQILKIKKEALLKPHKIKSKQVISNYIQENPNRIKLNIGSGGSGIAGWLNGDIWFYEGTVYMDVAETLPFNNSSVQFIKTEHMIEHLEYATCKYFFQECFRVLQSNGVLRISTPSLEKLILLYSGQGKVDTLELLAHHRQYHQRPTENINVWFNDHVRLWGHKFIFDQSTLLGLLKEVGFTKIKECKYGESEHSDLQGVETHDEDVEWMRWAYVMIFEVSK